MTQIDEAICTFSFCFFLLRHSTKVWIIYKLIKSSLYIYIYIHTWYICYLYTYIPNHPVWARLCLYCSRFLVNLCAVNSSRGIICIRTTMPTFQQALKSTINSFSSSKAHVLLKTKPHKYSYFVFSQKILKLKHKKLNARHHELFSSYRKMGVD